MDTIKLEAVRAQLIASFRNFLNHNADVARKGQDTTRRSNHRVPSHVVHWKHSKHNNDRLSNAFLRISGHAQPGRIQTKANHKPRRVHPLCHSGYDVYTFKDQINE